MIMLKPLTLWITINCGKFFKRWEYQTTSPSFGETCMHKKQQLEPDREKRLVSNLENSAVATELEKVSFHSNPKERQCQRMFKLPHNYTHLTHWQSNAQNSPGQASTVHSCELPDVQAGFRNGRGTRDQNANIRWIIEKAREFQKNIYFCFVDYAKAFDCVDHNKLGKILKEMGISDHLICLLRNLYAGQEPEWKNGLFQNWERRMSRLYNITLLIQLICRVHHAKCGPR